MYDGSYYLAGNEVYMVSNIFQTPPSSEENAKKVSTSMSVGD